MLLFLSFEHANRLRGGLRFAFLLARARHLQFAHKKAPKNNQARRPQDGPGAQSRHEIKQSDGAAEELIIAMPLSFFLPGEVIIPFPK